jgi:hypothetical protein
MNETHFYFLFATPSFVSGASRLLDWHCFYDKYNDSRTEREADYKALLSDWYVVGRDICTALNEFDHLLVSGKILQSESEIPSTSLSSR